MADQKSIRFYKFITPPEDKGATVTIGNKTVTGSKFSTTITAINSLGATVNSIGTAILTTRLNQQQQLAEMARKNQLARDKSNAAKMAKGFLKGSLGFAVGALLGKTGSSFMGNLGKLFKGLLIFSTLDWISKDENQKKLTKIMNRLGIMLKGLWNVVSGIVSWIGKSWNQLFGDGKSFMTRLGGATKLLAGVGLVGAGLAFLKNPATMLKAFSSMLQLVGKGVLNLAKVFGGNVLGQAALGLGQGFLAYNDIMNDEDIPEEDRQSAAVGGGVGATTGAMALGALGNQLLPGIGGAIGNLLGGFLGKHVGKYVGPIVKNIIEPIKKFFARVGAWVNKTLKPVGDAIKKFFVQYAETVGKVLDFIEPHMPRILEIASFIGKYAMAPLITLLTGLTKVLSWVSGGSGGQETEETITSNTFSGVTSATQETFGGKGGSTYSLKGSNFLGDFIAKQASNNRYDATPDGMDTSLTQKTVEELIALYGEGTEIGRYGIKLSNALAALKNSGKDPKTFKFDPAGQDTIFKELKNMAGFQDFLGDQIDVNQFALNLSKFFDEIPANESAVSKSTRSWNDTIAMLESLKGGMSKGGLIRGPQSGYPVGFNPILSRSIGGFVGHGEEMIVPIDTPDTRKDPSLSIRRLLETAAIIGSKGDTGTMLASLIGSVNQAEEQLESAALTSNIETVVLDVIERPLLTKQGGGSDQEIVLPSKPDEINSYIQSRFGYMTEKNTSPSNLF